MKPIALLATLLACCPSAVWSGPALTVYNQDFAVVRGTLPLDLKPGENEVRFAGVTALVEPQSVALRDATGRITLNVLEQNYRNDPINQSYLLSLFEGKTINFLVPRGDRN